MIINPYILIKTPDMTTKTHFALSSDLISELLTGMRLRGVQYHRVQTGNVFGFDFQDRPGHAYFYFLAVGHAYLRMSDGTVSEISSGNAVLIPQGERHQILSNLTTSFDNIDKLYVDALGEDVSGVNTCPSTHQEPSAIFFYGCMSFDLGGMHRLGKLMPKIMVVDTKSQQYPGLLPILDSMKREICAGRIGFAGILSRLAEVAAAMIVRGWVEGGCENTSGFIAALRDPSLARAILALHREPGREWTVADLAAESYISRSVFAQRFQSTIGISPMRYVTELRMRLANQWLSQDGLTIEITAQRLGYTSQAAFSRAFKRIYGQTPGSKRFIH